MTAHRHVTLTCDHERRPGQRCSNTFTGGMGEPAAEVRREAKLFRWSSRRVRSGGPNEHYTIDLCPMHAATGGES